MSEQAVCMKDPVRKLATLETIIPDASDTLIPEFGRFLSGYLKDPRINPIGFVTGCTLAIHDLQNGINGFTGEPIQSRLVGYPSIIYDCLRMSLPRIVDAVFPQEFAASVKAHLEAIEARIEGKGEMR